MPFCLPSVSLRALIRQRSLGARVNHACMCKRLLHRFGPACKPVLLAGRHVQALTDAALGRGTKLRCCPAALPLTHSHAACRTRTAWCHLRMRACRKAGPKEHGAMFWQVWMHVSKTCPLGRVRARQPTVDSSGPTCAHRTTTTATGRPGRPRAWRHQQALSSTPNHNGGMLMLHLCP